MIVAVVVLSLYLYTYTYSIPDLLTFLPGCNASHRMLPPSPHTTHHTPHTTQDAFTLAVDFFRSKNYMVSEQKVAELWAAEDTDPSDQVSCKYMH